MKYIVRTKQGDVRFFANQHGRVVYFADRIEGGTEFGTREDAEKKARLYNLEDYKIIEVPGDDNPINLTEIGL